MSNEDQQLAVPKTPVPFGKSGVVLASLDEAYRFATAVSRSGFAPKGMEAPESILIAIQFGAELGLTPMSSLQSLAIVNGRPSIYGDAALALVRGSGYLETYKQTQVGEGDNMKAIVTVKRKGEDAITSEFSVADAKKAGLWGKTGPWSQFPGRMLMWRARGFALRDAFGDVLRGLATSEENQDLAPHQGFENAKVISPIFPEPAGKTPMAKDKPKVIDSPAKEVVAPAAVVEKKPEPETKKDGE